MKMKTNTKMKTKMKTKTKNKKEKTESSKSEITHSHFAHRGCPPPPALGSWHALGPPPRVLPPFSSSSAKSARES